jgi:2-phospho-L-lactate guanylyltransferase
MCAVTAAIPVKPFDQAKQRLSTVLDGPARRTLGERLALRTIEVVASARVDVLVLSADDGVTAWARSNDVEVILDEGSSLDRAASVARDHLLSQGKAWMVVHADLPVLQPGDVELAARHIETGSTVLAPSSDGGTSMIGASTPIEFSYGPGSFHRHLAAAGREHPVVVMMSTGWALDLDTPADFAAVIRTPAGRWLEGL